MEVNDMYYLEGSEQGNAGQRDWKLRDLCTGNIVEVLAPSDFVLETVLIDSAYYNCNGKEYRFLLCQAREAGLNIRSLSENR
jgi:hypothetical protein